MTSDAAFAVLEEKVGFQMNKTAERRVKKAITLYLAGKPEEALRMLVGLIQQTSDHSEQFGLLYYEMIWLLDAGAVSKARAKFNEMQVQMSLFDGATQSKDPLASTPMSPPDTDQDDLAAYLAVVARFAEAKLLMKEGNESLALNTLEDLMARYPKQLSLRKFRELRGQADMHRGILLVNADRWLEAGEFLERAIPPKNFRPRLCYCLGQYYCTIRDYKRAAKNLKQSITPGIPPQWRCRAHYMLGLAEFHLSHVKEAKKNFELSVQTADPEYIRRYNIWGLLEEASRTLGLNAEADKYRKIRKDGENP
jgi:tetratricopeptide (TPR) repeat protein